MILPKLNHDILHAFLWRNYSDELYNPHGIHIRNFRTVIFRQMGDAQWCFYFGLSRPS